MIHAAFGLRKGILQFTTMSHSSNYAIVLDAAEILLAKTSFLTLGTYNLLFTVMLNQSKPWVL
jgi:hypothetical protein